MIQLQTILRMMTGDDRVRSLDEVVSDYKVTTGDGFAVEFEANCIRFCRESDGLLDTRQKTRLWIKGGGYMGTDKTRIEEQAIRAVQGRAEVSSGEEEGREEEEYGRTARVETRSRQKDG